MSVEGQTYSTNTTDLFFALSSDTRKKIIQSPLEKMSISEISKITNQSPQALHRHLKILENSNIIKKNNNGSVEISEYGQVISRYIQGFDFLFKNSEYFKEHDFGDTPLFLRKGLSCLSQSEFVGNQVSVFARWRKMVFQSKRFACLVLGEAPIDLADVISKKIASGLMVKIIFGGNTIFPENSEFVNLLALHLPVSQENIQRRMCKQVEVSLIMTENQAAIMFPGKNSGSDMGQMFIGKTKDFLEWCNDFFNYKWQNSNPISRLKIPAVDKNKK